ncbi:MAG: ATP-binding protein [Deltaproteobacteria bacterium]|jgi:hypothetical protein|nr:ATP-binding protein [Deltaproteobacteria bacterium]
MSKITIGEQNFSEIISENYVYADKTEFIYNILNLGKSFFLSRPMRFGKTLLLNTFKELFSGRKELFEKLWIGQNNRYNFEETFPVVNLSLSMAPAEYSLNALTRDLQLELDGIARSHNLSIVEATPGRMLFNLIKALKNKYSKNVVLLIDEYDAPVSYYINKLDIAEANQETLSGLYSKLKFLTDDLRFLFVTGVTSYSFIWHSGALNHLNNLTLNPQYSDICGFTYKEMDACFKEFFPVTLKILQDDNIMSKDDTVADLRQIILDWYDGYSWNGKSKVLNPYSLLNFFSQSQLTNYWTELEPSKKFINAFVFQDPLAFHRGSLPSLRGDTIKMTEMDSLEPAPVLFQTGFLTVGKVTSSINKPLEYRLKVPNKELKSKFNSAFTSFLFKTIKKEPETEQIIFQEAILSEDAATISNLITANFNRLPAQHHFPSESRYHGLLFFYFLGMPNVETLCEPAGAEGTPDLVVKFSDLTYVIIELKYLKNGEINDAKQTKNEIKIITERLARKGLKAIETLNYAAPYLIDAKKIVKMGLGVYGRGHSQALFGD